MKKKLACLVLALSFLFDGEARADGLMLNAVTSTGASEQVLASAQNVYGIDIQIWSATTSSATIVIECKSYVTAPWWPCTTVTDPDSTGVFYSAPLAYAYRLNVTNYNNGTISGTIVLYKAQ